MVHTDWQWNVNSLLLVTFNSTVLTHSVTENTTVTVVVEHIEGVQYQVSATIGDDTVKS